MADQRDEAVRKGAHCGWHIHYPIVVPVKDRKALRDEVVTTMIRETAVEIAERFPLEMEAIGTDQNHIQLRCSAHPKVAPGRIVQIFKSITRARFFAESLRGSESCGVGSFGATGTMWLREGNGQTGRLSDGICSGKGSRKKISGSSECFSSVILRSLLRGASIS